MEALVRTPWDKIGDAELKKQFIALYRVRPQNEIGRMEAALLVFRDSADDWLAYKAAAEWPYDRVCIDERARLDNLEKSADLPSKELQAREIWNMANDKDRTVAERLQAHKLYAEIQGNIVKAAPTAVQPSVTFNDNRRVMYYPSIPHEASDVDAWERQAVAQQARLVADAASN